MSTAIFIVLGFLLIGFLLLGFISPYNNDNKTIFQVQEPIQEPQVIEKIVEVIKEVPVEIVKEVIVEKKTKSKKEPINDIQKKLNVKQFYINLEKRTYKLGNKRGKIFANEFTNNKRQD